MKRGEWRTATRLWVSYFKIPCNAVAIPLEGGSVAVLEASLHSLLWVSRVSLLLSLFGDKDQSVWLSVLILCVRQAVL